MADYSVLSRLNENPGGILARSLNHLNWQVPSIYLLALFLAQVMGQESKQRNSDLSPNTFSSLPGGTPRDM